MHSNLYLYTIIYLLTYIYFWQEIWNLNKVFLYKICVMAYYMTMWLSIYLTKELMGDFKSKVKGKSSSESLQLRNWYHIIYSISFRFFVIRKYQWNYYWPALPHDPQGIRVASGFEFSACLFVCSLQIFSFFSSSSSFSFIYPTVSSVINF